MRESSALVYIRAVITTHTIYSRGIKPYTPPLRNNPSIFSSRWLLRSAHYKQSRQNECTTNQIVPAGQNQELSQLTVPSDDTLGSSICAHVLCVARIRIHNLVSNAPPEHNHNLCIITQCPIQIYIYSFPFTVVIVWLTKNPRRRVSAPHYYKSNFQKEQKKKELDKICNVYYIYV